MKKETTNHLQRAIQTYEDETGLEFTPTNVFYQRVGINFKRFGMIKQGKLQMTLKEAQSLAAYFKLTISDFLK